MRVYWPLLRHEPTFREYIPGGLRLLERICGLIVCNPDINKMDKSKLIEMELGIPPDVSKVPSYVESICQLCIQDILNLDNVTKSKMVIEPALLKPVPTPLWVRCLAD